MEVLFFFLCSIFIFTSILNVRNLFKEKIPSFKLPTETQIVLSECGKSAFVYNNYYYDAHALVFQNKLKKIKGKNWKTL